MNMEDLELKEITNMENVVANKKMAKKSYSIQIMEDNIKFSPHIDNFPNYSVNQLSRKNKLISKKETIQIVFEYPLTNKTTLEFTNIGGFTYWDFFRCVYEGYYEIYATESDPGYIPNMYNRSFSTGPYGIWGHYLGDLVIEGFYEISPNKFGLVIGS